MTNISDEGIVATIIELEAAQTTPDQIEALRGFADALPESQLRDVLLSLTTSVSAGTDLAILSSDAELTPTQVAQRLRMSRTHIYKLIDSGEIPAHHVGRDRRVLLADVVQFEVRRQQARRQLAERFARADETRASVIESLADEL
ncbi:helix-turn-helix domain-containing protein [Actinotalea ferrariae]|uniref:helix-turn-helix domain-containing protein n=1 Tax=Actinotalea ferrariae TaxID=1386098 RepID=UPI001C8C3664|nr:helix-turn-helix domain-containing protein [Actinotalea ferrariae]MBX9243858.1 helix-turn-helix domain-containing protein [Actinotalea ferrariae]